jgi:hypothetical protein
MTRAEVYALIDGERAYQDRKWGGMEHDERHTYFDWFRFIQDRTRKVLLTPASSDLAREDALDKLREIAALATAALELFGAPERDATKKGTS